MTYGSVLRELFVVSAGSSAWVAMQERNRGTAGFTLALPVSRAKLEITRAAVGGLDAGPGRRAGDRAVLCSPLVHESYPVVWALRSAVAWSGVGCLASPARSWRRRCS